MGVGAGLCRPPCDCRPAMQVDGERCLDSSLGWSGYPARSWADGPRRRENDRSSGGMTLAGADVSTSGAPPRRQLSIVTDPFATGRDEVVELSGSRQGSLGAVVKPDGLVAIWSIKRTGKWYTLFKNLA